MKIFSIKNEKLNFFNRPIYCESAAEALSYVQNILMSDADRALSGLKDDLALYELGEIDFQMGLIIPYSYNLEEDGLKINEPNKVCSLREIFDSIPEDKIHLSPTKEQFENCLESLSKLSLDVKELSQRIDIFENTKKKGNKK